MWVNGKSANAQIKHGADPVGFWNQISFFLNLMLRCGRYYDVVLFDLIIWVFRWRTSAERFLWWLCRTKSIWSTRPSLMRKYFSNIFVYFEMRAIKTNKQTGNWNRPIGRKWRCWPANFTAGCTARPSRRTSMSVKCFNIWRRNIWVSWTPWMTIAPSHLAP